MELNRLNSVGSPTTRAKNSGSPASGALNPSSALSKKTALAGAGTSMPEMTSFLEATPYTSMQPDGAGATRPLGPDGSDRGPEMEGWLLKWTNYVLGHQERYFVLSGNVLSYYRDRSELQSVCRGSIYLGGAEITKLDPTNFLIATSTQTIYLRAQDELNCKRWLKALSMAKTFKDPHTDAQASHAEFDHDNDNAENGEGGDSDDETDEDDYDPVRALQGRLEAIRKAQDVVIRETAVMQVAFTHVDSKILAQSPNIRQVHKQGANLYTFLAGNLVTNCQEYLTEAGKAMARMQIILKREQSRRQKLELTISQLARQHQHLEKQASNIVKHLSEDQYQLEEEEIFFDAPEDEQEDIEIAVPAVESPVLEKVPSKLEAPESPKNAAVALLGDGKIAVRPPRRRITYRVNRSINFWSVLKNFIGKDLTKIPMPVAFNEPLSMLQRLSEDLEYTKILKKAVEAKTSQERLCYVAAFTASSYSTVVSRTYKPFNPLLGETFELDLSHDPEYGWRSIAEQVSHHPPIAAMHTETEDWEMIQQFSMDSKFRGKYMQIVPTGISCIKFKRTGEKYTWTKVTTTVHNIIVGKLWIDQSGEMQITDHTTGDVCKLTYVPYSYFSREPARQVKGTVEDRTGRVHYVLEGTWDRHMAFAPVDDPDNQTITWEVNALPPDHDKMYGFSYFACRLNEPLDGVAPTDARLRPDQRALENQCYEQADQEKHRLEEKQRAARKAREETHEHYAPKWFHPSVDPDTRQPMHLYGKKYWEARAKQEWDVCPDIF
eukprot:comp23964_c0_seq1/m.42459 comp23964_c0_seq1/g.42459  ORF comp23964_c0_seq1/g.42459 comp23964_c0_seq1/m.42459 type:complete len:776 (-) comp23964_c0_seq1:853-3180(-)